MLKVIMEDNILFRNCKSEEKIDILVSDVKQASSIPSKDYLPTSTEMTIVPNPCHHLPPHRSTAPPQFLITSRPNRNL
jgi:hypothetical protein